MRRLTIVVVVLVACASAAGATPVPMPSQYSLQHHPVSTSSAQAQAAFDEGLTLLYAFNRIAARQAFQRAAAADPGLAMAYWGIGQSYGPNINTPAGDSDDRAGYDAVVRARALSSGASDEENAYVSAEAARFSNAPHPNYPSLARAYERAMGDLMRRYPDDLDAATLHAQSEMDLHPWAWFTSSGQPVEGTNDIISTLESVLSRDPMHIGANHLYIHATEQSTHPERALASAQRLGTFTFESAAAHLVHMPAHTYMRAGFFDLTASSNIHALAHDRTYLVNEPDREASVYYSHNLYFLMSAYQMEGDYADTKQAAAMLTEQGAEVPATFASCRFARWHDILALSAPKSSPGEPLRVALWHYARGLAFAGTGDLANAQKEREAVAELDRTLVIAGTPGLNNGSKAILGIGLDVLDARISLGRNKPSSAVALLTQAVRLQDNLLYVEPPDWYYPVRESLGAAFLRSGDARGAERAFRDDLVRNPRNGRSLFGLAEALKAQGDATDEAWVRRAFEKAWRKADTTLTIDQL